MEEAHECTQRLCTLVEEMLESNRDLSERIRGLERGGAIIAETRSQIAHSSRDRDSASIRHRPSTSTSTPSNNNNNNTFEPPGGILLPRFTFEEDLSSSRVYGRAGYQFSQLSLTSAVLYTTALSIFSKLSLSQVSNLPSYALPVFAADLGDNNEGGMYVFGEEEAAPPGIREAPPPVVRGESGRGSSLFGLVSVLVGPALIIGGA